MAESPAERKERLRRLKEEADAAEGGDTGGGGGGGSAAADPATAADGGEPVLRFRNYAVKDKTIAHTEVAPARAPEFAPAPAAQVVPRAAPDEAREEWAVWGCAEVWGATWGVRIVKWRGRRLQTQAAGAAAMGVPPCPPPPPPLAGRARRGRSQETGLGFETRPAAPPGQAGAADAARDRRHFAGTGARAGQFGV